MEDYKVKDLSLAEFGRKEISIAESEMPGLMALRKKIQTEYLKDFIVIDQTSLDSILDLVWIL